MSSHLRYTTLGYDMMFRAVSAFGETSIPRAKLLAQFEAIVTNYPRCDFVEQAEQTASVLRRMIAEDEAHAKLGLTSLARFPVEEQVSELIFRLRDQNGWQSSQPGYCDVFADRSGSTNTPAHQLARLGYTAVPQLIAALDDTTYSRSVGYHRNFYFSHTILTVGDCAEAILERISGREFFARRTTSSYMSKDNEVGSAKKAVEAWWAEATAKGEKQMLIEGVTAAGQEAPAQAGILRQRYPDAAAAALIRGAGAATNSWVHAWLVQELTRLDGTNVTDFLEKEMAGADPLEYRVSAADHLLRRGKTNAVPAMIREWENLPKQDPLDRGLLAHFLAKADSVEAVRALSQGLRERPVSARYRVVCALGETNSWDRPQSSATLAAVEESLEGALDDLEEHIGDFGYGTLYAPRICDAAGFFLAKRWPDRYAFDLSPSLSVRERQRVGCLNVWRAARNLAALPLPQPAMNHLAPELANTVTAIEWETNSATPEPGFAAKVEEFRGKPLTAQNLTAFLSGYGTHPEPRTSGLAVTITRDEDLTGMRFSIRLTAGIPPRDSAESWNFNRRIILASKTTHQTGGGDIAGRYSGAGSDNSFVRDLTTALRADPRTALAIWFSFKAPYQP